MIEWIIAHRLEREAKVVTALAGNPGLGTGELVVHVYAEVPAALHGLAERSLLAHLEKLAVDGRARLEAARWYPA